MSESEKRSDNQTQPSAGNAETGVVKYDGPKSTPGPWAVDTLIEKNFERYVIHGCGLEIAKLVRFPGQSQSAADASLIAAAPDMLAALQAALPVMIDDMKDGYERADGKDAAAIKLIRAALAKAEPAS